MDILGFIFGTAALAFGIMAHKRVEALENKLKELEVLDKDYRSGEEL